MPNERTDPEVALANPFAGWLVGRMAQRGLRTNHLASAMTARGLKMSKSMISSYRNGASLPDPESSDKLADFFGDDRSAVWGYVRAARVRRGEPGDAPADDPPLRELIRLTVLETIEQMGRRRTRVPAEEDPVVAAMVAEINAELATMSLEEIEETRHCFRDELRRHRRAERERLQENHSG